MLTKIIIPRLLKMRFHRYFLSYFPREYSPSQTPISVLMPLALKDLNRAEISIPSIWRHVKHPIAEIVVVGQDRQEIRKFCSDKGIAYINENDVLPPTTVANGVKSCSKFKPTNFIRQQLIKLSAFEYMKADNILIHDADTYFMRDVAYCCGDRQILFVADEYTDSYEKLLFDLLGPIKRYRRSFVAHSMLFQRELFSELNNKVYKNCGVYLTEAILAKIEEADRGGLSEFELYGNFLHSFHKDAYETRYWYNKKIPSDTKLPLEQLEAVYWNMNSVSCHEH